LKREEMARAKTFPGYIVTVLAETSSMEKISVDKSRGATDVIPFKKVRQ
jgi:hypothetical protein